METAFASNSNEGELIEEETVDFPPALEEGASNSNGGELIKEQTVDFPPASEESVIIDDNIRNNRPRNRKRESGKISGKENMAVQNDVASKKQHTSEKKPNELIRYDHSLGHFPQIDKSRIVRCKYEECDKKTYVWCRVCKVHICLSVIENRNCFTDFHTKNK